MKIRTKKSNLNSHLNAQHCSYGVDCECEANGFAAHRERGEKLRRVRARQCVQHEHAGKRERE